MNNAQIAAIISNQRIYYIYLSLIQLRKTMCVHGGINVHVFLYVLHVYNIIVG